MDMIETRREVLRRNNVIRGTGLEIGAYARPTVVSDSCAMKYLDYYSTEELHEQAISGGYENIKDIIPVNFVCRSEDYSSVVQERFDLIVANHVMEHIIEPIKWLNMLTSLLEPNGHIFLALPDKKFSFDRYRKDSDISDLLYDHFSTLTKEQKAQRFALQAAIYYDHEYIGGKMDANMLLDKERLEAEMKKFHPGIHCHVFQGETFADKIVMPLLHMGLVDLTMVDYVPNTNFGEFYVLLRKGWKPVKLTNERFYNVG